LPDQIKQVALDYGLMSAFTAFIAVDSSQQTAGTEGTTVPVAVPVPEGVKISHHRAGEIASRTNLSQENDSNHSTRTLPHNFAGCRTKTVSISNSGYRDPGNSAPFAPRQNDSDPGFEYRGELSEFDVLGITRNETASEADIEKALATAKQIRLKPGASVMLVQSGAIFPDATDGYRIEPAFPCRAVHRRPTRLAPCHRRSV